MEYVLQRCVGALIEVFFTFVGCHPGESGK